jgi:hypothetical protein
MLIYYAVFRDGTWQDITPEEWETRKRQQLEEQQRRDKIMNLMLEEGY